MAEDEGRLGRNLAAAGELALTALPFTRLMRAMSLPARAAVAGGAGATLGATTMAGDAEAQTPGQVAGDPRVSEIDTLNKDIARRERILEGYATRKFESKTARQEASKPHLDAIEAARARTTLLQGQLDAETGTARTAQREASKTWRER